MYSRIAELENILEHAVIIDENDQPKDQITIGSKVGDQCQNRRQGAYQVVGSQEADPMHGAISEESPFGKALLGAKVGDEVTVEAPVAPLCTASTPSSAEHRPEKGYKGGRNSMAEEKKQGAAGQNIGDILKIRRDKLSVLQEAGQDPFQRTRFEFNCTTARVRAELTPWRTRRCVWPDA